MKRLLVVTLLWFAVATRLVQAQPPLTIFDFVWSPDGNSLAVASSVGIQVYDVGSKVPKRLWEIAPQSVNTLLFSPSGNWLVAGSGLGSALNQGLITVWESGSGNQVTSFEANLFAVYSLAFSSDGKRLASGGGYFPTRGGGDYRLRVWDTSTWQDTPKLEHKGTGVITGIGFSPDGKYLMYGSIDGAAYLLDAETGASLSAIHEEHVRCIRFSSDSSHLVLGFYRSMENGELQITPETYLIRQSTWSDPNESNIEDFLKGEYVLGCDFDRFITSTDKGVLNVRDVETGKVELTRRLNEDKRFTTAKFSPDGSRIAFVTDTNVSPISGEYQSDQQISIGNLDNPDETVAIDLQ